MDPLSLRDVSNGLGDTAGKKKKKKSNKIVPVEEEGSSGAAPTEHKQNDKTPKKLKPLKLKSAKKGVANGVSQAETTEASQAETHTADIFQAHADSAADDVAQNSGDRETGGREVKMIEQHVPPWWKPPLGSDPVAGAEADHARVGNWRDGRDYAMQARRENQPHVPAKELYESSKSGSPGPFSLCLPVFSQRKPNLSDLGVGICLYFDTLRAYGVLFFGLFLLNSLSIIITFATNPMAGKDTHTHMHTHTHTRTHRHSHLPPIRWQVRKPWRMVEFLPFSASSRLALCSRALSATQRAATKTCVC